MADINLGLLTITPSAGLEKVGEPVVSGNVVTVKFKGTIAGTQTLSASYDGGEAVTSTIIVRPQPAEISTMTPDPASIAEGADSTVTLAFDKELVTGQAPPTISVSAELTVKTAFALNESRNGGTVVVTGLTEGAGVVTAILGGKTKTANITVTAVPAVLSNVVVDHDSIEKDTDVTVTANFDKAPDLASATFTPSAEFTEKTAPAVVGNTIVAVYTGTTEGAGTIAVKYGEKTETANVTVTAVTPAIIPEESGFDGGATEMDFNDTVDYTLKMKGTPVLETAPAGRSTLSKKK